MYKITMYSQTKLLYFFLVTNQIHSKGIIKCKNIDNINVEIVFSYMNNYENTTEMTLEEKMKNVQQKWGK